MSDLTQHYLNFNHSFSIFCNIQILLFIGLRNKYRSLNFYLLFNIILSRKHILLLQSKEMLQVLINKSNK